MSVYSVIKFISKNKHISIYRLEKELSFANGTISKWSSSMPSADKLQEVATYLDVTSSYILSKAKEDKIAKI